MLVAIVILNYNGAEYLRKFLPAVIETAREAGVSVIVADNASTDNSMEVMENEFGGVELINIDKNLGFAEGYNVALRQVKADIFILLNSDVEVTKGWLQPCIDTLNRNDEIAACQPKIKAVHDKHVFEYAGASGGWLDKLGYPFCRGRIFSEIEEDNGQYDDVEQIFWASGAALFIKSELFHAIGGFDGEYFAHAEEIDLCWRLRRAGYQIYCVPSSIVYHIGGGTLGYESVTKTYLNFRNTLVTGFKNEPISKLWWWLPMRFLMDGMAGMLFLSQRKWGHIGAIVRAHWHFLPRLLFWWKRRKENQKLIAKISIGDNSKGRGLLDKSIVWHFYILRKKRFSELFSKAR